jgi:hypothetical protein
MEWTARRCHADEAQMRESGQNSLCEPSAHSMTCPLPPSIGVSDGSVDISDARTMLRMTLDEKIAFWFRPPEPDQGAERPRHHEFPVHA